MNHTRFDLVGKYKFKSVFVKVLVFLLIYSFILIMILFSYNQHIIRRNVEQRLELRTVGLLEKTHEGIDRELQTLSSQIVQLSKDEHIRAGMTAPNIKNATRNYNIVYQLQSVTLVNNLISQAFLYIPTDNTFFSSEGVATLAQLYEKNDSEADQLIEVFRNSTGQVGEKEFISIGDSHYLLLKAPYFYDRVLGILAFKLDAEYLNSRIEGRRVLEYSNTIWTFDKAGIPVFPSYLDYPQELTPDKVTEMMAYTDSPTTANDTYYKVVSSVNGWQYILRTDTDIFKTEASVDGVLVLIILVLAVFCIIFSIYMARGIYLPIHKLLGIATYEKKWEEDRISKNELELLEKSVSDTVMRNHEMNHFLQNIKPAMVSDTFRNLLMGHEMEKEKLDHTFQSLGTEFDSSLNYSLSIISVTAKEKDFSLLECNILLHRLEQEIILFAEGEYLSSFVYMLEHSHMAVVMGFSREVSAKQIYRWKDELYLRLREICATYPVQLLTGTSRYLIDIMEIHQNFTLISKDLNYKIYLQDIRGTDEQIAMPETDRQMIVNMFVALKARIDNGEDASRAQVMEVAYEMLETKSTPEELKAFVVTWWEAVMNELIPLNVFENEEELYQERHLLFASASDKEIISAHLERFNDKIVEALKNSFYRRKRRYVERAKQYIEEHYSDSDLSLSHISEYLGISQSYMSTQFKKETGVNFVDYVNRYRVDRSKLLLRMTEMTIEEVGFKTGFSSAKNFIRVFKKYTTVSPGVFREQESKIV